jgi:hypothetical protein
MQATSGRPAAVLCSRRVINLTKRPDKQTRFQQYWFTVSVDGVPFRILSDFSRNSGFAWRPDLFEHEAHIKVGEGMQIVQRHCPPRPPTAWRDCNETKNHDCDVHISGLLYFRR